MVRIVQTKEGLEKFSCLRFKTSQSINDSTHTRHTINDSTHASHNTTLAECNQCFSSFYGIHEVATLIYVRQCYFHFIDNELCQKDKSSQKM